MSNGEIPIHRCLVVALPAEAKPVRQQMGLIRDNHIQAYPVYRKDGTLLIISGVGRDQAKAATRWVQETLPISSDTLWINVGIAGHPGNPVGEAVVADSVGCEMESHRHPLSPPQSPCARIEPLITLTKPDPEYQHNSLCDMEAMGFVDSALRTANSDRILCFKVISDNRTTAISKINGKRVSALIASRLPCLQQLIDLMEAT
ncbi:MAG: hypothetical protein GY934_12070 [Gammaproteobacteria bacterium]|nr:hypothetical protein [Gammaproteobacteria bacterium]